MIQATGLAFEKIGFVVRSAKMSAPRTGKSTSTIQEKHAPMDQKIQQVINAVNPREGLSGNARAKIIRRRWKDCYPEENPPSKSKLQKFFKEH